MNKRLLFMMIAAFCVVALAGSALAAPYIDRVRPRCAAPGQVVRIIGSGFGETQNGSVVGINGTTYDHTSPRIKFWSNTKIKIRIGFRNRECEWFKHGHVGHKYRRQSVWVTVNGVDSNKKRLRISRPDECACTDNSECGFDEYCEKIAGDCEGLGDCMPTPVYCPTLWDPVCGCDGITYPNECTAAGAGVNVDYDGECLSTPTIEEYSNSGCLPEPAIDSQGDQYPWCGDDQTEVIVEDRRIHVIHKNATYNCCPDDIQVSLLSVEGNILRLTETEILTVPCTCLCCYDVEATVVGLSPGTYTVEYCWHDYETGPECYTESIVVP